MKAAYSVFAISVVAGCPNITGTCGSFRGSGSNPGIGALYNAAGNHVTATGNSASAQTVNIDASRSSSIYGNSSTVQPSTCKCYFCIKF